MENWEIAALTGMHLSNRNRQNVIDALKLKLNLEDDAKKQAIIQAEIDRIQALLDKEKHMQKLVLYIFLGIMTCVALFFFTQP